MVALVGHMLYTPKKKTKAHSSVVDSQNTGSLSIEIPEHRVLENRNTAQFVSVGEGQMLQFFSSGRL